MVSVPEVICLKGVPGSVTWPGMLVGAVPVMAATPLELLKVYGFSGNPPILSNSNFKCRCGPVKSVPNVPPLLTNVAVFSTVPIICPAWTVSPVFSPETP